MPEPINSQARDVAAERMKVNPRYVTDAKRIQTERKLGTMLREMPKATGTAGQGRPALGGTITEPPKDNSPTLAELGIDKKLSSRAQASHKAAQIFNTNN
jgi:hypothetical protein